MAFSPSNLGNHASIIEEINLFAQLIVEQMLDLPKLNCNRK
jgi:hypothetical protein